MAVGSVPNAFTKPGAAAAASQLSATPSNLPAHLSSVLQQQQQQQQEPQPHPQLLRRSSSSHAPLQLNPDAVGADDDEDVAMHFSDVACVCLHRHSLPRRLCIALVSHSWFDPSIDVCIVANSICLALREPSVGAACRYSADPAWHDALLTLDVIFTSIFAAELALKLVALGVVAHPGSYFRDPWNWIDAFVVVVAVLGLLPTLCAYLAGLSALRAVRLLRTMRKLRHVSGGSFVTIVSAFIGATPKLVHVAVLLLFTFLCFGILGNQLFMGALRQRCHIYLGEALGMVLIDADTPCGDGGINQCGGWRAAGHGDIFNATWRPQFTYSQGECSGVSTAAHGYGDVFCCVPRLAAAQLDAYYNADLSALPLTTNPDFGFTSFDTVPEAWLVVYRAITLEDWAVVMQMLRSAYQPAYGGALHAAPRPHPGVARRQPRPRGHV